MYQSFSVHYGKIEKNGGTTYDETETFSGGSGVLVVSSAISISLLFFDKFRFLEIKGKNIEKRKVLYYYNYNRLKLFYFLNRAGGTKDAKE